MSVFVEQQESKSPTIIMTSMTAMISYLTLYARVKRDYNAMIDGRGWDEGGRAAVWTADEFLCAFPLIT